MFFKARHHYCLYIVHDYLFNPGLSRKGAKLAHVYTGSFSYKEVHLNPGI